MSKYTFSPHERLKSTKQISMIFEKGKMLKVFPIRFHYTISENKEHNGINVGFVVPKRNFKKAVDRNRHKRRMFEAVRLGRERLMKKIEEQNLHIDLMVVYIHREEGRFDFIEKAVKRGFEKLEKSL